MDAALESGVPLSLISESVFARCLSSTKDLRVQASTKFSKPKIQFEGDKKTMLEDLGKALYLAKIVSYTQGFDLLAVASKEHGWNLNLGEIARIWRGGCIIRSVFLDKITAAYEEEPKLQNLLFAPYFETQVENCQESLRIILCNGIIAGTPMPSHSSALNYFDGLRTASLPANLLQAQRDYFGAHMFERTDKPRGEWFHANWTGAGGATTSSTYSK